MSKFTDEISAFLKEYGHFTIDTSVVNCKILLDTSRGYAFHLVELCKVKNISPLVMSGITNEYSKKNIHLIHVWEDVWYCKKDIVKYRLLALYGHFTRIHARQTKVIEITKPELDTFLNTNHLQGTTAAKFKYGLTYNNQLVAVASFASFRNFPKPSKTIKSTELVRFANLSGYRIAGGLGKLIEHFIRTRKPDEIMSYADRDWALGNSYKILGFQQETITNPQEFYIDPCSFIRYYANKLPEKKNNYIKVYNSGNVKFKKYILL